MISPKIFLAYPIIGFTLCLSTIFPPIVGAEDSMIQLVKVDSAQGKATTYISSSSTCIKGNGKSVIEERYPEDFSSIKIDGAFTVTIALQQQKTLSLKGDENLLSHFVTTVKDQTLLISTRGLLCPEISPEIHITNDLLASLSVDGATDIRIADLDNKTFVVQLDGASDLSLSGASEQFMSKLEGSSTLRASELETQDTTVTINGVGKALVNASRKLDAEIKGVGDILYAGKPSILNERISGVGHIEPY